MPMDWACTHIGGRKEDKESRNRPQQSHSRAKKKKKTHLLLADASLLQLLEGETLASAQLRVVLLGGSVDSGAEKTSNGAGGDLDGLCSNTKRTHTHTKKKNCSTRHRRNEQGTAIT